MADDDRSGLTLVDAVLLVGGAVIAVLVFFALFHFIVGVVWFAIKVVAVLVVVALIAWLLLRRHS
jgi:hypothetical protein